MTGPEALTDPVHGIVDMVGGRHLVEGYARLAEHGTLVSVGRAATEPDTFPPGAFSGVPEAHDRALVSFFLLRCTGLDEDLTLLAGLVASGELDARISWRGTWDKAADAIGLLVGRRLHGKAVLDLS
ncbi:zinc-binding dehydrogenase [Streptomyces sp. NPDC021100]|uniref:zinc-binding dehydrogenase n=1 Tax=Streptomyces sp. NPDC021100 TaxID=3365114 RepID=UPI003792CF27